MTKGDLAKEYFLSGKNCSTSVVLAFKDELKVDEETLKKLAIGYGGGLGRQRLTCGAVLGLTMVLGGVLSDGEDKLSIYAIVQEGCNLFKAETGSIICGELLSGKVNTDTSPVPEERTEKYYKKRPCADLCKLAGDIAEQLIKKYK